MCAIPAARIHVDTPLVATSRHFMAKAMAIPSYYKQLQYNISQRLQGHQLFLCGAAVSYASKLQPLIPLSTAEGEYLALSLATQEAMFIRHMQGE
mmetsp:Transcript_31216/g.80124  ORF Transcript_31216/g.80124 Transcript_31216/m.80124 type:complete len:95 (-) Transcript_31216:183-467(-)